MQMRLFGAGAASNRRQTSILN